MEVGVIGAERSRAKSVAALFIDADNLPPTVVDQVFGYFRTHDIAISVRHAHGGLEKLAGMKEVLRKHAVRAYVNQGKGTTDVALAIDVVDMLHGGALQGSVAVVSSDADFAPLALRVREAGLKVLCFALRENADSSALDRAYDEVIFVDVATSGVIPEATAVLPPVNKPATAQKSTAVTTLSTPHSLEDGNAVLAILKALPDWLPNTIKQLNQIGKPLRAGGIAKGSKPLHELFRKHPTFFKVLPTTGAPKQVRLLKIPA